MRSAAILLSTLLLGACAAAPAPVDAPVGWRIEAVDVTIAEGADLEWCETRYGCGGVARRVERTVAMGLGAAVSGLAPAPEAPAVRIVAEVHRFRGLGMGEALGFGGRYDVALTLTAEDVASGRAVGLPRDVVLDHYGLGGVALLIAEGGQRERLAGEIARAARFWIAGAGEAGGMVAMLGGGQGEPPLPRP